MKGYRKLIVTLVMMLVATLLIAQGVIDQETFKWLMTSSGVAYLASNAIAKFGQ